VNRRGSPWLEGRVREGGRYIRRDGIQMCFRNLHPTPPGSLKMLRATSSTLLDSSESFSRFSGHFLAHSAGSTAERHYLNRSGEAFTELFDQAVAWLGRAYGFLS
jgi:hypothetical protein